MAGDLDALRSECEELSKKRFRAAFVSLVLLFVTVLAFTRAFQRIDEGEARTRIDEIAKLARTADTTIFDVSYVFERALAEAIDSHAGVPAAKDGAELVAARRQLETKSSELEQLAAKWFSIELPLGGANVELDLRHWLPLLPLILWASWAYLGIAGAKLRVVRQLAGTLVTTDGSPLDRLHFSGSQTYTKYPDVLAARTYGVIVVVLIGYFVIVGAPMWQLLVSGDGELVPLYGFVLELLLVPSYFVAALISWTHWRLHREAAAIAGAAATPLRSERLLQWLRRGAGRVTSWLGRVPRTVVTIGSAAVIISPFTMLAKTCDEDPRSGADLLLGRNDVNWFTSGTLFNESWLPHLGRAFYAATILLALVVLTSAIKRSLWLRAAPRLRPFAAAAALFMLVETGYVFFVSGWFLGNDPIRIAAVVVPLLLLRRGRLSAAALQVCLIPACVIAPFALIRCAVFGLTGIPLYVGGLVLIALPLLAPQESEVAAPAAVAPAYSPSG